MSVPASHADMVDLARILSMDTDALANLATLEPTVKLVGWNRMEALLMNLCESEPCYNEYV